MELHTYMERVFPGLKLRPSLYEQWGASLHFEFAKGQYQFLPDGRLNKGMFDQVYEQATVLFERLFSDEDELFLVTNIYQKKSTHLGSLKLYSRYLKDKNLKYKLKLETLPYIFNDVDNANQYQTLRFSLRCQRQDIHYQKLIKAICHEDFHLKPRLGSKGCVYYPDVFFINKTKDVIYFIYDDRGAEVVAKDGETLRPVYENFSEWLAKDCKEKVQLLFEG